MSVLVWIDKRSEVSASLDGILFHSYSIVLVAFWVPCNFLYGPVVCHCSYPTVSVRFNSNLPGCWSADRAQQER